MSFFLVWGFLLWLVTTLVYRLIGQYLWSLESLVLLLMTFALVVPLVAALTYPIYDWRKVKSFERPLAAIYILLPGMLLNIACIPFFPIVFPNLPSTTAVYFCALVLWTYSLVLLTSFVPKREARVALGEKD
jgi:hypothetical protein